MDHVELKRLVRSVWPSLKKPFFGHDTITCRDGEYPEVSVDIYEDADRRVWETVKSLNLQYGSGFPDCDDFSDIKLGLFKIEWWKLMQSGCVPNGAPPRYAVLDGYNPTNEMHDFNAYVANGKVYVSDYGRVVPPDGYRPILMRF